MPVSNLIVRDRADYPDAEQARASLPDIYQEYPYVGVWLQPGDPADCTMYVFTTLDPDTLRAEGWDRLEEPGRGLTARQASAPQSPRLLSPARQNEVPT